MYTNALALALAGLQYALMSISWIANQSARSKRAVARLGAVPRLIQLVQCSPGVTVPARVHESAVHVLLVLSTEDEKNQVAIAKKGESV
jgi:hypothetical protein